MDCSEAKKLVVPFVEHKISDEQTGDFIKHVRNCPTCYEELETYYTIYSALDYMDSGAREGFDIKKRLDNALAYEEERSRAGIKLSRNIAIGAVLIVIALFILIILFTDIGEEIGLFNLIRTLFGGAA
ncbi:MAG: zf-HC2 domain-containing protein [Lachnospiraceae bacterium]|nr:zf-HC2 domain-containing protein [Lachnospiraceae bacterium]